MVQFDTFSNEDEVEEEAEHIECNESKLVSLNGELICLDCGVVHNQLYNVDVNTYTSVVSNFTVSDAVTATRETVLFETFFRQYHFLDKEVKNKSWNHLCQTRTSTEWESVYAFSVTSTAIMAGCISLAIYQRFGDAFSIMSPCIEQFFSIKRSKLKKCLMILENMLSVSLTNKPDASPLYTTQMILNYFCYSLHISTFCVTSYLESSEEENYDEFKQPETVKAALALCRRCTCLFMLPRAKTLKLVSHLSQIPQHVLSSRI